MKRGCGCGLSAIAFIFVCIFAIALFLTYYQHNSIRQSDAYTDAIVSGVKSADFIYSYSDRITLDYKVDGKDYQISQEVKAGSVNEGDTISLYYNPDKPQSAESEEIYEYDKWVFRYGLVCSVIIWGILFVFRLIGSAIGKHISDDDIDSSSSSFTSAGVMQTNNDEERFWNLYSESLLYKNHAWLTSALKAREKGLRLMENRHDYYCMAQHNLMVLQYYHRCDGVAAYESGKNSLRYKDEYRALSDKMIPRLGYSAYDESLLYTATLAKNREEAMELFEEVVRRNTNPTAVQQSKEMLSLMDEIPRWSEYQKNFAHNFYSRHTPQEDKGDYSPACALLGLILSREGEKGYDLSQEEYVDMLDDYLIVSLKYFTLRSDVLLRSGGTPDQELLFIVKKPLKMLIDFLPDCEEERFRNIFRSVMSEYKTYDHPFRKYLPEYEKALSALGM